MARHYDSDDDLQDRGSEDREISLGTGTVLGIFFALAVVCALFFGLGYSMGRKSAPSAAVPPAGSETAAGLVANSGGSKPFSGNPAPAMTGLTPSAAPARAERETEAPARRPSAREEIAPSGEEGAEAPTPQRGPSAAVPAAATKSPAAAGPSAARETFVQVAAVTHKEDAELLLGALKRRGYQGAIRQAPEDKLLHVQIGPFATKKDAEAWKQRLTADGYNPILK